MDAHQVAGDAHLGERWTALLARQEELEDSSLAKGASRFRRRLEQAREKEIQSTHGAAKRLLTAGLDPLEKAIAEFLVVAKGKRGMKHVAVKWIELLGNEAVAYMALKCTLDTIEQKVPLTKLSRQMADLVVDELRYRRFKQIAPALFDYKMAHFETSSYAYMARSLDASISFLKCADCQAKVQEMADVTEKRAFKCEHLSGRFEDLELSPSHRLLLGTKLVDLVISATGLIEVVSDSTVQRRLKKSRLTVQATEETRAWLETRNGVMAFMSPVALPMVVPPIQWAPGQRGGYRYGLRNKFTLVRGVSKEHGSLLDKMEMPKVHQAINAIQNTAWRVNESVACLIDAIAEQGGALAGVAALDEEPAPAKPHDIDTNPEAKQAWKKKAHARYTRNVIRGVKAKEFYRTMDMVNALRKEEAIFFPYNLDFRGRIYPVCAYLSPQGDDLSKSLLTFAQGKPIGEDGLRWLMIHGANKMDTTPEGQKVSKMTLDERVEWVKANERFIVASANRPLDQTWWTVADKPLQFYAFCVEYRNAVMWGPEYVCSLPVAVDGSCNGLQHFSAMLRDEIGGAAVNVVPGDRPQDVYARVSDHVTNALEELLANDPTNEAALRWLSSGLLGRKLVKRPTMTYVYGSKVYGFQAQLLDYLRGLENYDAILEHFTERTPDQEADPKVMQACALMSGLIWNALQDVTIAAAHAMSWLQSVARVIVKAKKPVTWRVPATGFPVKQEYYVLRKRRIDTILAGHVIRPDIYDPTPNVESYKQANAISPNVVHSLDAAALMLSVSRAMDEGVEAFAAIHDSYGTVPADMAVLARAARQSFVSLYTEHDVVAELYAQFVSQVPEGTSMPAPPKAGNLDVSSVLASDYFFC